MGSRDGMTKHKDRSLMGKQKCSQKRVHYSGQTSTGTYAYTHAHTCAHSRRIDRNEVSQSEKCEDLGLYCMSVAGKCLKKFN